MTKARLDDSHQDSHQAGTYRRIELITGETRRRRWTTEEKAEILAESFQPGASVSEVARRHEPRPVVDMASRGAEACRGGQADVCADPDRGRDHAADIGGYGTA